VVTYTIWHISKNRNFPLNLNDEFKGLVINECSYEQAKSIQPNDTAINLFFFQMEAAEVESQSRILDELPLLLPYFRVILVPEAEYRRVDQLLQVRKRLYVLDDGIKSGVLQMFLSTLLQMERYRQIIQDFAQQLRAHREFYDSFSTLIQKEMSQMKNESVAYQHLLEFEQHYRLFEERVNEAINEAFRLKEHEMLRVQNAYLAMEKLQDFRDTELQHARETLRAAEIVLNLSREENLERDKIIEALQRLNIYTDAEVLDLYKENQELRQKLGMPLRD